MILKLGRQQEARHNSGFTSEHSGGPQENKVQTQGGR